MKKSRLLSTFFFITFSFESPALGKTRPSTCTTPNTKSSFADLGKRIMPLSVIPVSVAKEDWWGILFSQTLIQGLNTTNRPLEKFFDKKRPCGCRGAFPSGHMIMYASSASLLHYRYGWQYGLPAYLFSLGFTYDRVKAHAHSWLDMAGTAVLVNVISYLLIPRHMPEVEYWPAPSPFQSHSPSLQQRMKEKEKGWTYRLTPSIYTHQETSYLGLKLFF